MSYSLTKRVFDVAISLAILLLFLPLLLLIALIIRWESPGPALFRQLRTGLGGRQFTIYKLRSMVVAEDAEVRHASKGDPRVTRIGAFLRKSSLDELPQLLNVLKGDMSIVGPRPHAVKHDHHYGALIPTYADRFRAKPGLTGLAQIAGYRGEVHDLDCMVKRVSADNAYIDEWSIGLDLRILLRTVPLMFRDPRAY